MLQAIAFIALILAIGFSIVAGIIAYKEYKEEKRWNG